MSTASRGLAVIASTLALAGCGAYHNPSDVAKIKELEAQRTQLQAQLIAETSRANAIQERLAFAAEQSAQAQRDQARAAQMQATLSVLNMH